MSLIKNKYNEFIDRNEVLRGKPLSEEEKASAENIFYSGAADMYLLIADPPETITTSEQFSQRMDVISNELAVYFAKLVDKKGH